MAACSKTPGIDSGSGGNDHARFDHLAFSNGVGGKSRTENSPADALGRNVLSDLLEPFPDAVEQVRMVRGDLGLTENAVFSYENNIGVRAANAKPYDHRVPLKRRTDQPSMRAGTRHLLVMDFTKFADRIS